MRISKHKKIQIGDMFGKLLVIAILEKKTYKNDKYVKCKCDCGKIQSYGAGNLRSGTCNSCGCLQSELIKKRCRKAPGETFLNKWERTYREGAIKRSLVFELDSIYFRELVKQNCFYCNSEPIKRNHYINKKNQRTGNKKITDEWVNKSTISVNGIDRLKNNDGYTKLNSVACCSVCNFMKRKYSKEEFISHVNKIVNYQKVKK